MACQYNTSTWKGLPKYSSSSWGICGEIGTVDIILGRKVFVTNSWGHATTIFVLFLFDGRARARARAHSSRKLASHERKFLTSFSLALNFCIVIVPKLFLAVSVTLNIKLFLHLVRSRACYGLASSRPAPSSFVILNHIASYANRSKAFVSVRRTHQGLSGRRLRGSLEQLRVTGLLKVEHRESSHHYTSCSIGGPVRACQRTWVE